MKRGEIIKKAYALWALGEDDDWVLKSPYICDNIHWAVEYGAKRDQQLADEICALIRSVVGWSVQDHLGISPEAYDYDEIRRSRDPLAMAFRLGMWQSLAKRYGVEL